MVTLHFKASILFAKFLPRPIAPPVIKTCYPEISFFLNNPFALATDFKKLYAKTTSNKYLNFEEVGASLNFANKALISEMLFIF